MEHRCKARRGGQKSSTGKSIRDTGRASDQIEKWEHRIRGRVHGGIRHRRGGKSDNKKDKGHKGLFLPLTVLLNLGEIHF